MPPCPRPRTWPGAANIGSGSSRKNRIAPRPVVADGRVFTIDAGVAVTATSTGGATLWSADLTASLRPGRRPVRAAALPSRGTASSRPPAMASLWPLTPPPAQVLWRQRVDAPVTGAPATDGEAVYVSGRDGSAWAVVPPTAR